MAAAAEVAVNKVSAAEESSRETALRDRLWVGISEMDPTAVRNSATAPALANTLNVSFPGCDGETLLMGLDLEGVAASSGSACMVGSIQASHVLLAMGVSEELARATVRFSLGRETTPEAIDATLVALSRVLGRQARSPEAVGLKAWHHSSVISKVSWRGSWSSSSETPLLPWWEVCYRHPESLWEMGIPKNAIRFLRREHVYCFIRSPQF